MDNKIIEISNISEISGFIQKSSLVLFDVDDTLIHTSTHIGSRRWVDMFVTALISLNKEYLFKPIVWDILKKTPYQLVEKQSQEIIQELQKNKKALPMGYTARPFVDYQNGDLTHHQLKTLGISFDLSHYPSEFNIHEGFKNGIIFSSDNLKGDFFENLLFKINYRPSFVLFVDDRKDQIQSVSATLSKLKIPSTCFLYNHLDIYKEHFDMRSSAVQMDYFIKEKKLISNKEAFTLKDSFKDINIDDLFKNLIETYELDFDRTNQVL